MRFFEKEKNVLKKKDLMVIVLTGIFLILISAVNVSAATNNPLAKMPKKDSEVLNRAIFAKGATFMTPYYSSEVKISVNNSNPSVATVKTGTGQNNYTENSSRGGYYAYYEVVPVSPGNTKIKVTVTINKKSYTKTCNYTVYKWENPFKKIKIGSTEYQSKLNKKGIYILKNKKTISGKITYKLNPDFVITKITACYYTDPNKKYLTQHKDLKNGDKLPKNTIYISICAKSKKNKLDKYTVDIDVPFEYQY